MAALQRDWGELVTPLFICLVQVLGMRPVSNRFVYKVV